MTNAAFSQYVQSTAFNLSLSIRMIGALVDLHEQRRTMLCDTHCWGDSYGTNRSLLGRGLVIFHGYGPIVHADSGVTFRASTRVEQVWELTTAGVLTLQLLVEAGLVEPTRVKPTRRRRQVCA